MTDILIATDNTIEVLGVENAETSTAITTAAVTVTLVDATTLEEIAGETWPLALIHDTNGDYRATFSDELELSACYQCIAQFNIDAGSGLERSWETLYPVSNGTIAASILADNTDHIITLSGLDDAVSPGSYFNAATVTLTLYDIYGAEIGGEPWPLTLAYKAASNGVYKATLRDTLDIAAGDAVKMHLIADNGADYHREWRSILTVQTGS